MAGMSAYYLSKRREEEEAQRRAVQEQVDAKNTALCAKEAQQREQAKIQNYLQGKAMLEAQLKNSGLGEAEQEALRAYAKENGMEAGLGVTSMISAAAVAAAATPRKRSKKEGSTPPAPKPPMPPGLPPEAQAAFLHSPEAAKWIAEKYQIQVTARRIEQDLKSTGFVRQPYMTDAWMVEWGNKCLPILRPDAGAMFNQLPPGDAAKYGKDLQDRYFNFDEFIQNNPKFNILPASNPWWSNSKNIPSHIYNDSLFSKILTLALVYERELGTVWNSDSYGKIVHQEYRDAFQETTARKLLNSMREYGPDWGYYYYLGGRQTTYGTTSKSQPEGLAYAEIWPVLNNSERFQYALKSAYEVFYPATLKNIAWCEGDKIGTPNDYAYMMRDELNQPKNKLLKEALSSPPGNQPNQAYAYYTDVSVGADGTKHDVYLFILTSEQINTLCPGDLNCVR